MIPVVCRDPLVTRQATLVMVTLLVTQVLHPRHTPPQPANQQQYQCHSNNNNNSQLVANHLPVNSRNSYPRPAVIV